MYQDVNGPARPTAWGRTITFRLLFLFPLLSFALFLSAAPLYADTVTIVDGADIPPTSTNDLFTDAYIQNHLNITGSLTIDTASATGGGPDEIRVEPGVYIDWTEGTSLTLRSGANIVISGTIRHDGPEDGSGGVLLDADGDVLLGLGNQPDYIEVGSRHGLTRVDASSVRLQAGTADYTSVQLGFYPYAETPFYTVTGSIFVTAQLSVTASAGSGDESYVQIGHGGMYSFGTLDGSHGIQAGGDIVFTGGSYYDTYAQVGNGGAYSLGDTGGSHQLRAGADIRFVGGSAPSSYVQVGNGGWNALGSHSGSHVVVAAGDLLFTGGIGPDAYAQVGNGGTFHNEESIEEPSPLPEMPPVPQYAPAGMAPPLAPGDHSGNHTVTAQNGTILFTGGGPASYAQVGNGGFHAVGNHVGNHVLSAGRDIRFTGGEFLFAYAQAGNGGWWASGDHSGTHRLEAGNDVHFQGGIRPFTYAHAGNGGPGLPGSHSGDLSLTAGADIGFTRGITTGTFAQAGNGVLSPGDHSGALSFVADGSLTLRGGRNTFTFARIGHGDDDGQTNLITGTRRGDITLVLGQDLLLHGGQIGHATADGSSAVSDANTYIAVSQNDPYPSGTGVISATNSAQYNVRFNSAPQTNGGELRFYVPDGAHVSIPVNTFMNNEVFPGSVPPERMAGFYLFAEGPYIPDYSFYFGPRLALIVEKTASVSVAAVGEEIAYSYRITNTGEQRYSSLAAVDDRLGPVTLDASSLAPGAVATGQLFYTVQPGDLPGPLLNTVTVTGTSETGAPLVMSDSASVALVDAAFLFTKTVGIAGIQPECTDESTLQVPISTTVVYCFTLTNTGSQTLTSHRLEDDQLGTVLNDTFDVAPGATFSTTVTRTIYASVTNVAVWTAGYPGSDPVTDAVHAAALPAQRSAQATVTVSSAAADEDRDGIPDNFEGSDDPDGDNIPNFQDPDSDDDNIPDQTECPALPCQDSDNNGAPDFLDRNSPTNLDSPREPLLPQRVFLPFVFD